MGTKKGSGRWSKIKTWAEEVVGRWAVGCEVQLRFTTQPVGLEHLCAASHPISHGILLTESFKPLAAIYDFKNKALIF